MTGHFAYFLGRTVRNRMVRYARRMRSPRYAIAALIGFFYFFIVIAMPAGDGTGMGRAWLRAGGSLGPLLIALLAAWWWLWGGHRRGLMLSPAEAHLLLPAPLTRAQVVRFKIMQAQTAILFSAFVATLFVRGTGLPWALRLLSAWIVFATLHQHQIAASLVHAAADGHGRTALRRNAIPMAAFGIAFITIAWSLFGAVADIRAAGTLDGAADRLLSMMDERGPAIVLAPFRLLLAPALATSLEAWLLPFAGACVLLAAHYLWLVRTDAAFEETAANEGRKREELAAGVKTGGFSRAQFAQRNRNRKVAAAWLPLSPRGINAYAIFWKNVLYTQRAFRPSQLIGMVIFAGAIIAMSMGEAERGRDVLQFAAIILLSFAAVISVFGPLAVRNDLRMDLRHIDQLRTYPVRSRDLAAAEVAAATLTLTVPQYVMVPAAVVSLALNGSISAGSALLLAASAIVALPVVNALSVIIQNVLALLYPSWIRLGESDAAGMEMMGQNMIIMIGTIVLLAISAVPIVIAGAVVGAPLSMVLGQGAIIAGAGAALVAAAAEVTLAILWLGRLYDRTDPVTAGLLR